MMLRTGMWLSLFLLSARIVTADSFDAGDVTVEFDRTAFNFESNDGFSPIPVSPETVSITSLLNGVDLQFNGQMSLTDFATGESDPMISVEGSYNAGFSFLPEPGFSISGYRVTIYGTYDTETPGQVDASLFPLGGFSAAAGSGNFSQSFETVGPIAPALVGTFSALGSVNFLEVQVGTESVFVGFIQQPDPNCVDPDPAACPMIDVPVYEDRPVYMMQADLGGASINLQGISVEAHVVPEPASLSLLGSAALLLGGLRRRRSA